MEEWSLRNWNWGGKSAPNGGFFTSHPFHIHVNDYQVKQSDNELPNKRSLEDVTQMNSSGYNYVDSAGVNYKLDPLVGEFVPLEESLKDIRRTNYIQLAITRQRLECYSKTFLVLMFITVTCLSMKMQE